MQNRVHRLAIRSAFLDLNSVLERNPFPSNLFFALIFLITLLSLESASVRIRLRGLGRRSWLMHQAANHEAPTIFVLLDILLHNVFVTKTVVKLLQIEKVRCTVINDLCLFALFDASCFFFSRCRKLAFLRHRLVASWQSWDADCMVWARCIPITCSCEYALVSLELMEHEIVVLPGLLCRSVPPHVNWLR